MGKANSTFILHPEGRSDITFNTLSAGAAATGYYTPSEGIRFHEAEREEIFYSGGPNVDGGEYISSHGPLVPVEFVAYVIGATKVEALQRAQTLKQAVCNQEGGTLEYMPEGVTARSTFYHYVKSPVPALVDNEDNAWDGYLKHEQSGTIYVQAFEVVLQTLPMNTSDPDSLVSLSPSRSTLSNTHDTSESQYNFFDITGTDIHGDLPAIVRLRIRDSQTQDYEKIGRVYVTTRSTTYSVLANLVQIYEAENATVIQETENWTSDTIAARSNDGIRTCRPPVNNVEHILRFAISNESDHRGRIAIMACVNVEGGNYDAWRIRARYYAASDNIQDSTPDRPPETFGKWHIIYCGELDFPPTKLDVIESISPSIDLILNRTSGDVNDAISIDFIALLFLDEPTMQFDINDGFGNSERLLSNTTPNSLSIAHIVDQSTLAINRVVDRHYGSSHIEINPGKDTRIMILFERIYGNVFYDDFDDYESRYWLPVMSFETSESLYYSDASQYAYTLVEGEGAIVTSDGTYGYARRTRTMNLDVDGRFTDDDYVCIAAYLSGVPHASDTVLMEFRTSGAAYYLGTITSASLAIEYNYLKVKKSDMTTVGSPDWAKIVQLEAGYNSTTTVTGTLDCMRIEKADPDDATVPNATGTAWNFQPTGGRWTITKDDPDDSTNAVLACLDPQAAIEKTAVYDTTIPSNVRGFCRVLAMSDIFDSPGKAGLIFRVNDQSLGSEDLYAFLIDFYGNELEALEYVAGTPSSLATAVSRTVDTDTWYWLGFDLKDNQFFLYFTTTEPTSSDNAGKLAEILTPTNRVFTTTDSTLSSGKVGFMSIATLARFDDLYVEYSSDRHVPADQVTVVVDALFRSTYPFAD